MYVDLGGKAWLESFLSERSQNHMATIATVDLKSIHETYKEIEKEYSQYGERFLYFLATCLHVGSNSFQYMMIGHYSCVFSAKHVPCRQCAQEIIMPETLLSGLCYSFSRKFSTT